MVGEADARRAEGGGGVRGENDRVVEEGKGSISRKRRRDAAASGRRSAAVAGLRERVFELVEELASSEKSAKSLLRAGKRASSSCRGPLTPEEEAKVAELHKKRLADICHKQGLNLVRSISNHKWSWPFNEPVDPVKLGIPDYYTVIKKPMDLGTVRRNIEKNLYSKPEELLDDMRQTFRNATTFNVAGSDVYIMAMTVWDKLEERWQATIIPKIEEATLMREKEEVEVVRARERAARATAVAGAAVDLEVVEKRLQRIQKDVTDVRVAVGATALPHDKERIKKLASEIEKGLTPEQLQKVVLILEEESDEKLVRNETEDLEVDMNLLDTIALKRIERALKEGCEQKAGSADAKISAPTTVGKEEVKAKHPRLLLSRPARSRRRADRRGSSGEKGEDEDVEIV